MNVLSLFSGIGGFELGLMEAGLRFKILGFSEVDPYASKVLAARFPDVINWGDVRDVTRNRILAEDKGEPDLIVAGFPCQDLSVANVKRRGLAGMRSGLISEFVRLRESFPHAHFIVENVASMSDAYRDQISNILDADPVLIDSAALGPTHRKRLYWASFPVEPAPTLSLEPWSSVLLPPDAAAHLALSDRERAYMDRKVAGGRDHWAFGHHFDTAEPKAPCLTANLHKGVPYNVLIDRRPAAPLVRKLHSVECERLMGFPDNWTAELSMTRRLRAIGNSVSVPTIAHIARGFTS